MPPEFQPLPPSSHIIKKEDFGLNKSTFSGLGTDVTAWIPIDREIVFVSGFEIPELLYQGDKNTEGQIDKVIALLLRQKISAYSSKNSITHTPYHKYNEGFCLFFKNTTR